MSRQRELYVRRALALYRTITGEHVRPRSTDRRLAEQLHDQGIRLDLLEAAMRLAVARRNARPDHASPLPPVRSLHYYRPVIDEITRAPHADDYVRYLLDRESTPDDETPTTVQKTTFSRDR